MSNTCLIDELHITGLKLLGLSIYDSIFIEYCVLKSFITIIEDYDVGQIKYFPGIKICEIAIEVSTKEWTYNYNCICVSFTIGRAFVCAKSVIGVAIHVGVPSEINLGCSASVCHSGKAIDTAFKSR